MALTKQYGLAGVYEDVQFGKSNGRIKFDNAGNVFSARNLADSDYVNFRVAEPVSNRDAATKYYVDSVAQGLKPKSAVRVATNGLTSIDSNVNSGTATDDMTNLSYSNEVWTLTGGVIDGVTLADGDRVLIKDATGGDAVGNGIWVFDSSTGTLSRSADADNAAPAGEAAASTSGDIIIQGQKSDPSFATGMTYTLTANGVEYTYGPTTTNDRDYFAGINGLNIPGLTIGSHNDDGFINGVQLTYTPQAPGDQLIIANTTGWAHLAITPGTYTSSGGANAAGAEMGGGVFVFVLEGTVWQDSGWVVNNPTGNATLGTDAITWAQFSRVSGIYANDGLAQDGNRIYVRTDGTTIHLDNDDLAVKSSLTQYQSLISDGAGGTATWTAISLDQAAATQNTLLRSRGGFSADVSAFANQSLYLSDLTGNSTTELAVGTANQVLRVDGTGTLGYGTLDLGQTGTSVSGVLDETNGGTGESTYAQYDLLFGDATNKLTKLSVGLNNQVLRVSGAGVLEYGAVDLAAADAVTGTLPESHGGTGQNAYTKGDLLYAGATGADGTLAKLGIGNTGEILLVSASGIPSWSSATSQVGVESTRRVALGTSDVNIGAVLPANSRVVEAKVSITSAYTAGTVITLGRSASTAEIATADEIDPETTGIYQVDLMQFYGSATQLLASVTGASTGAGYVVVTYIAE